MLEYWHGTDVLKEGARVHVHARGLRAVPDDLTCLDAVPRWQIGRRRAGRRHSVRG